MKAPASVLNEPPKKKVDVRIVGIQTPTNYICWNCYKLPTTKEGGLPYFRSEITGKEICSICSKSLEDALIIEG